MDDPNSRDRFYEFANWCYQGGVFVSRSSGTLFSPSLGVLWLLPALQALLLCFFLADAMNHLWYNDGALTIDHACN